MKKLKTQLLSTLLGIIISSNTYAVFGIGDIVSDPSSYGYYVEQLKSAADQLESLNTLTSGVDDILADTRELFDFTSLIKDKFKDELAIYNTYRNGLNGLQRKKLDFNRKFDPRDLRDIVDENLDGVFVDPDDPLFNTDRMKKSRNYERQRLLKQALIKSEEKLTEVGHSYEQLADYAEQAKKTKSEKAAADLTNAILLEILKAVNNMVEVMSSLGQAEMALKYTHYNKEQHEDHIQAQKIRYPNGYKDVYDQVFASKDAYIEHSKKCGKFLTINRHSDTTIGGKDCSRRASKKYYGKK